jgi:hypothetical protein
MRSLMLSIATAGLLASTAGAQNPPAERPNQAQQDAKQPAGPGAPNVVPSRRDEPGSSSATSSTPPIAGANSFTETQARERIASAGFGKVQNLKQDQNGVWRGRAQKDGRQVGVALDYRGNVVQQ